MFLWNIPSIDILTTNPALRYLNIPTKKDSPPRLFGPWIFSEANPSIHPKTKLEAENGALEEKLPFWEMVIRGSMVDFNQTWKRWDVGIPTHSSCVTLFSRFIHDISKLRTTQNALQMFHCHCFQILGSLILSHTHLDGLFYFPQIEPVLSKF